MRLKTQIAKFLPNFALKKIIKFKSKSLIEEINLLKILDMGVDLDNTPWVELKNGYRFFGLKPSLREELTYNAISKDIQSINKECFSVVLAIVDRYLAPRSIPGQLTYDRSKYAPLRDPLNDFSLSEEESKILAERFSPKKGWTIVDIGAHHGFGTLRMLDNIGESGKIIAFEANPSSFSILKKNITYNKISNIKIIPKAVSDHNKKNGLFFLDGVSTGNSLRGDVLQELGSKNIRPMSIDIVTVDDVLSGMGISSVDHVSITINGGEPEALLGLSKILKQSENTTITMPGWYYRDGKRLDILLCDILRQMGFNNIMHGKLGRVLAW